VIKHPAALEDKKSENQPATDTVKERKHVALCTEQTGKTFE
jgi:hypothetical protein